MSTVPTPSVSASNGGNVLTGGTATISCTVSLTSFNYYMTDTYIEVMWLNSSLPSRIYKSQAILNDTLTITNVQINHAGLYICTARVFYNGTNHLYVIDSDVSTNSTILGVSSKY